MTGPDLWRELGQQLRVDAVRASAKAGSGHPTSSMSAADLAALSGAAAYAAGRDACDQARRTALQNSARVVRCDRVGDEVDFVVTVRTVVEVRSRVPGLPRRVEAEANAGRVE